MAADQQLPRPEERTMKIKLNRGFTLIELMIVVAIVAILASVAYPAYTSQIVKGKRAEGRTALASLMQQQERYLTQRNVYLAFTNTAGTTNPTSAATAFKVISGETLANSAYLLSAGLCPNGAGGTLPIADCVQVIATPLKPDPEAGNLQMTSTGTKDCTGTKPEVCWK
jgi:type IV pilus assembly protein PilE